MYMYLRGPFRMLFCNKNIIYFFLFIIIVIIILLLFAYIYKFNLQ